MPTARRLALRAAMARLVALATPFGARLAPFVHGWRLGLAETLHFHAAAFAIGDVSGSRGRGNRLILGPGKASALTAIFSSQRRIAVTPGMGRAEVALLFLFREFLASVGLRWPPSSRARSAW